MLIGLLSVSAIASPAIIEMTQEKLVLSRGNQQFLPAQEIIAKRDGKDYPKTHVGAGRRDKERASGRRPKPSAVNRMKLPNRTATYKA